MAEEFGLCEASLTYNADPPSRNARACTGDTRVVVPRAAGHSDSVKRDRQRRPVCVAALAHQLRLRRTGAVEVAGSPRTSTLAFSSLIDSSHLVASGHVTPLPPVAGTVPASLALEDGGGP